jgi:NhaA family Na+:H+ antiporter
LSSNKPRFVSFLQEFSIPLIVGVFVALFWANLDPDSYHHLVHWQPFGTFAIFGHELSLHFLVNDMFMVFFFGIAAKEITEACLPGGSLNPVRKAVNPLLATLGGVLGPAAVFFGLVHLLAPMGAFVGPSGESLDIGLLNKGWGIPTATDIALAWLVARTVFGRGHPAINFLLLLAVADDAIGLVIIAVFYGDPTNPAQPIWLLLCLAGIAVALALRLGRVRSWIPYILLGGPLAWSGLVLAHLHPALALVFIVPFLPAPTRDTGMFSEEDLPSTLHDFEHSLKLFVDLGLFFFALTNAGVEFAGIGTMTWVILASLVVGKTVGISLLGLLATRIGFPLPDRMGRKELVMAGFVAALGLTVALFVAGAAFGKLDPHLEGQAKMGALFTGFVGLAAIALGRMLGLGRAPEPGADA